MSLDFRVLAFCLLAIISQVRGQGIPVEIFNSLSSEKFAQREEAQVKLRDWSRKQPAKAMSALHKESTDAKDPEVRVRCLEMLKEVVIEQEFRGEGYIGISMIEMAAQVPGDPQPRRAIRIGMVMPGTAAAAAGLEQNDLIIGLGDRIWHEGAMDVEFSTAIRETLPGTEVTLLLLKDGKVLKRKIRLGTKPDGEGEEGAEAARKAKDRFFQQWLDKQAAGRR